MLLVFWRIGPQDSESESHSLHKKWLDSQLSKAHQQLRYATIRSPSFGFHVLRIYVLIFRVRRTVGTSKTRNSSTKKQSTRSRHSTSGIIDHIKNLTSRYTLSQIRLNADVSHWAFNNAGASGAMCHHPCFHYRVSNLWP
ncbi:hypothetical protein L218DRAFT_1029864 [Marasmius fiardii PR-910]|nr:hypothetical protein L218DRAFT_1029864 [Marasmius fiardii PR-910]